MEFPPTEYDVFDAREFENARARGAGDYVMEVMLQMRPNGKCLDHFRVALTGTVLETQVKATNVFRAPILAKYRLTFQAWPRDLRIRRNMTSTEWTDVYTAISANEVFVSMEETGESAPTEEIKAAFEGIKESFNKSDQVRGGRRPRQQDVVGASVPASHGRGPESENDLHRVRINCAVVRIRSNRNC
jgi:hypothetical protein